MAHRPTARSFAATAAGLARPRTLVIAFFAAVMVAATLPASALAEPNTLVVPPPGGLTVGVAGATDPEAVAAAQQFEVEAVSMLDPSTQSWLVYVPGAPPLANTLDADTLTAEAIVTIRRAGLRSGLAPAPVLPAQQPAVSGAGRMLARPPRGGLVFGIAGTNDPATLAARQDFTVESVSVLDVPSQTWLVHVPSAPVFANSLRTGMIGKASVVIVRRLAPPIAPTPTPTPTATPTATPPATAGVNAIAESVLLASINEERVAAGLPALILDPTIVAVARAHSRDMIVRDYFDQANPDGQDPFDRMRAAGISFGYAAENIVAGKSGAGAHAMLMGSAPHRANIFGVHYRRVGIGAIVRPEGGVMVTELFAD